MGAKVRYASLTHDGGVAQLKLWNRFCGETGRTPCAPTILIHQLRCATLLHIEALPKSSSYQDTRFLEEIGYLLGRLITQKPDCIPNAINANSPPVK